MADVSLGDADWGDEGVQEGAGAAAPPENGGKVVETESQQNPQEEEELDLASLLPKRREKDEENVDGVSVGIKAWADEGVEEEEQEEVAGAAAPPEIGGEGAQTERQPQQEPGFEAEEANEISNAEAVSVQKAKGAPSAPSGTFWCVFMRCQCCWATASTAYTGMLFLWAIARLSQAEVARLNSRPRRVTFSYPSHAFVPLKPLSPFSCLCRLQAA